VKRIKIQFKEGNWIDGFTDNKCPFKLTKDGFYIRLMPEIGLPEITYTVSTKPQYTEIEDVQEGV